MQTQSIQDSKEKITGQEFSKNKCPKHGVDLERMFLPFDLGKTIFSCPECRKETEASENEISKRRAEIQEKGKQKKIIEAFIAAKIPDRFRGATLENYEVSCQGQKEAVESIKWFIENHKWNPGLIFIGSNGTGKNHLASALVKEFIRMGKTGLMTKALKIFMDIRDAQSAGTGIRKALEAYTAPDILVINEVGVQHETNFEKIYLTDIIDDRYEWLRPTVLIGNLNMGELEALVGQRAIERFKEGGRVVSFDWESFRGRKKR